MLRAVLSSTFDERGAASRFLHRDFEFALFLTCMPKTRLVASIHLPIEHTPNHLKFLTHLFRRRIGLIRSRECLLECLNFAPLLCFVSCGKSSDIFIALCYRKTGTNLKLSCFKSVQIHLA